MRKFFTGAIDRTWWSALERKFLWLNDTGVAARNRSHDYRPSDRERGTFKEIDRYPAVTRDVAMFVGREITHADIVKAIAAANEPLLEKVDLFDLFMENDAKERLRARKSLAYSLTYRDKNRTLTNEEVSAAHARIRERLRNDVGAELRE